MTTFLEFVAAAIAGNLVVDIGISVYVTYRARRARAKAVAGFKAVEEQLKAAAEKATKAS
jgi:hypothetical protein